MTPNLTTSIIHEVQSLINHLHIKGRIDYKTRAFLSPKTHPGLLYSTDYQKYTNLTVLYDPLSQPMTPQRTYHHMSITSYSHTWKQSRHSPKTQDTSDTINLPNLPEGACLVTANVQQYPTQGRHWNRNPTHQKQYSTPSRKLPSTRHHTIILKHYPNQQSFPIQWHVFPTNHGNNLRLTIRLHIHAKNGKSNS